MGGHLVTPYEHDGIVFDLDRSYMDVTGVEWSWSTRRTESGEPLMESAAGEPLVPLPDVYRDHGPLIPMPQRATASLYRRVLKGVA